MTPDPLTQREVDRAAEEAAKIGGTPGEDTRNDAGRAVREGGGGEAEGFEQAEDLLVEHASHGDQHAARDVLERAPAPEQEPDPSVHGEPDSLDNPDG